MAMTTRDDICGHCHRYFPHEFFGFRCPYCGTGYHDLCILKLEMDDPFKFECASIGYKCKDQTHVKKACNIQINNEHDLGDFTNYKLWINGILYKSGDYFRSNSGKLYYLSAVGFHYEDPQKVGPLYALSKQVKEETYGPLKFKNINCIKSPVDVSTSDNINNIIDEDEDEESDNTDQKDDQADQEEDDQNKEQDKNATINQSMIDDTRQENNGSTKEK